MKLKTYLLLLVLLIVFGMFLSYLYYVKPVPTGKAVGIRTYTRIEEQRGAGVEEVFEIIPEEDVYFGREYVEFEHRKELRTFMAEQELYSGEFKETTGVQLFKLPLPDTKYIYKIREWLIAHNIYRACHDVTPLKWDVKLAKGAQDWADTKPSIFANSHSPDAGYKYGENVAWASGGPTFNPLGAVAYWYGEINENIYNPTDLESSKEAIGHFTQVVWKDTKEIGGGVKDNIYVCQYDPAGNQSGEYQANVLPIPKYKYDYKIPFSAFYSNSLGKWIVGADGTTKCWQIDGHPTLGTDKGRNPNIKWILSGSDPAIIAYGEKAPPVGTTWLRKVYTNGKWVDAGGCWQGGGSPDPGLTSKGYWKLVGYQGQEIIRGPVNGFPDLRGIKIIEKVVRNKQEVELEMPACWEELDEKGNGTGVYYCELGTVTVQTWSQ